MDAFGDASGDLRGLLNGDCEVYVAAVVAGDRMACGRCAKKAVRQIDDIAEAKWNDLLPKQKRRLFECFADNDYLEFGYAVFTAEQLQSLRLSHLLYQDVHLPPDWDLALEGYAYGELLFELGAKDERTVFAFDRVASTPQSEAVEEHVQHFVENAMTDYVGSRRSSGVQSADCFAGAVAEDIKSDTDWLSYIDDENIYEQTHMSLVQLEHRLEEFDAGP